MADTKPTSAGGLSDPATGPKPDVPPKPVVPKAAPRQNPVFAMMGMPNFRAKLPSRNWLIFWSIIGSWSAAVYYDRREKKRIQKRWCDAVAHLAREPLPPNVMQRKVTVFLAAPPADGLLQAREHFHQYVRPILVSAGLNWDAIEGRREGDVRAAFSDWLRKRRKVAGEASQEPVAGDDLEVLMDEMRGKMAVKEWPGTAGDLVIGRNTWKEYVRGLHEGWLGPVDMPESVRRAMEEPEKTEDEPAHAQPSEPTPSPDTVSASRDEASATLETNVVHDSAALTTDDEKKIADDQKNAEEEAAKQKKDKKKKKPQPLPFISTSQYSSATLPPSLPAELPPTTIITFPHLLGFLNTPIRIYRYLTQRKLADEVGREAAAACFAAYRPFERSSGPAGSSPFTEDEASPSPAPHQEEGQVPSGDVETWEQADLLKHEEKSWHKSVRKNHDATKESVWMDGMVLDPRIAGRMRRFFVDDADVETGLELQATKEREDERLAEEKEADKKLPSPEDLD